MRVIIMRGLSGSGKSEAAQAFAKSVDNSVIVSASDYFTNNGYRDFDPTKLPDAHHYCRDEFGKALNKGVELIIVDNTNTKHWEYEHYVWLAKQFNYLVTIETIGSFEPEMVAKYAERNKSNVPLSSIKSQARRFEH